MGISTTVIVVRVGQGEYRVCPANDVTAPLYKGTLNECRLMAIAFNLSIAEMSIEGHA